MTIIPITLKQANDFVSRYHRHNGPVAGNKFSIGLELDGKLIGVAICARQASRNLDDGKTLEINRVCTDGSTNACSKLYGACVRIAKEMGYKRVITYTLETESGASVKAANFILSGIVQGRYWDCASLHRVLPDYIADKFRWEYNI